MVRRSGRHGALRPGRREPRRLSGTRALRPELAPEERRRLLRAGLEAFESGRYFDAHEAWEEVWRSTTPEPRDALQGLVQVAVGLHLWTTRGRPAPARRVLARGRRRLEPFAPVVLGLDVATLLAEVRRWEGWLETSEGEPPPIPHLLLLDDAAFC